MSEAFFTPRFSKQKDITGIKSLWKHAFGDSDNDIDTFFKRTFSPEIAVVIEDNGKIISIILLPESNIVFKGTFYKSAYCYCVCTDESYRNKGLMTALFSFTENELLKRNVDILFLVPETYELQKMYEKLGFKNTTLKNIKAVNYTNEFKSTKLTYETYKALKLQQSEHYPVNIWNEKEFDFFINSPFSTTVYDNNGYYIYNDENEITEICGDVKPDLKHSDFVTMSKLINKNIVPFDFYFGNPT